MGLAQGHNAVTPVRLEPAASRSPVKHSTTEQLRSLFVYFDLSYSITYRSELIPCIKMDRPVF